MTRVSALVKPDSLDSTGSAAPLSAALLAWYDRHRRELPWRVKPGMPSDPYRVWLSEIMLQQTTTGAVKPYYRAFLDRWPSVEALASAPLDHVLQAWAGLGYYSRARNLHACARAVVEQHGGRFPPSETALRGLPGVGAYTAAAIAAIAFDQRAVVVDGNVERVMARLFAIDTPLPAARPVLRRAMDSATPDKRAGDFAQAVMDLGATICVPRAPACMLCPLADPCLGRQAGEPARFPVKVAKAPVRTRAGAVFYVRRHDGALLVRSRPPAGLFGGMTELPGTEWSELFDVNALKPPIGLQPPITPIGQVVHGLTHFTLVLYVFRATTDHVLPGDWRWISADKVDEEPFPTLMRKVIALAAGAPPNPSKPMSDRRPAPGPADARSRRHRTS